MGGGRQARSGLSVTPSAASLCRQQAKGRALVVHFRELSPGGCCSAGAVVRLKWMPLPEVRADKDLVARGDADGVPVFVHHVLARFLTEHELRIISRGFGPWRWLAVASEKDPAMWCFFGDSAVG